MRINFLIIVFLTSLGSTLAQNRNSITQSFTYRVSYTSNKGRLIDDVCKLDVSGQQSFFYSTLKAEEDQQLEQKISAALHNNMPINLKTDDLKQGLCNFTILKDYKKKKAFYTQEVSRQNLAFVRDSLSSKRWTIFNEKKVINNLTCKKAQMRRDTTLITAWFAPEVPIPEGPLYYFGLPGLIVKVNTSAGWEATLIKINKVQAGQILKVPDYAIVTEAQLLKAINNAKSRNVPGTITLPSGTKATAEKN